MELSGAEILTRSLTDQRIDTIFGYPGSCVMQVLDHLYDNKDIHHILVRHEQSAVHAACAYAQLAQKPGVVLVTSGPGATNTITGIADAFSDEIPILVITGQVASALLGTDAFQEVDIINLTASITKWNYQIRKADQIADAVSKAFKIAISGRPGPVLLDITKDAQSGKAEYKANSIKTDYSNYNIKNPDPITSDILPGNSIHSEIIEILKKTGEEMLLVIDKVPNDLYTHTCFCSNHVVKSAKLNVPGFGLPAAIGAKYAVPGKTICLISGSLEFQATIKELGVIKEQGIDIKMILINNANSKFRIINPDFIQLINAYGIKGEKITKKEDLLSGIQRMLNFKGSYLLEIE